MRETIQNTNGKQFHAVSLSGGKDSTAMLLLMIERDMPIDIVKIARPYPHADMVLIRRPFSPNPFLPLHNFQRRFDFLGTQMHCFTEKHIRFGRSFTSQGANSLLLMDSEHRLSPARTDAPLPIHSCRMAVVSKCVSNWCC